MHTERKHASLAKEQWIDFTRTRSLWKSVYKSSFKQHLILHD